VGKMALAGQEGVETGGHRPASKYVKKTLISGQTPGYFSELGLTQAFE